MCAGNEASTAYVVYNTLQVILNTYSRTSIIIRTHWDLGNKEMSVLYRGCHSWVALEILSIIPGTCPDPHCIGHDK